MQPQRRYRLHPSTLGHRYSVAYPGRVLCVELIRDRLLYCAHELGAENVAVNPDCGLRTRTWEVAFQKLENSVKGAELARQALG